MLSADHGLWARFRDPAALEAYLDDPDFCGCEGNILTVGTVPGGSGQSRQLPVFTLREQRV